MTLFTLGHRIKAHFRPLEPAARKYASFLESVGGPDDEIWFTSDVKLTGREVAQELLRLLPGASTEEQRWVRMELEDLAK